ncbi:MAG TPA: hypothetical protein VJK06_03745 [Methyloceanibacter sp.]|nr:hypothetical protein [Methyloceanibacter sp.]
MASINPNKAGLAVGALYGAWHLTWSLLVALGLAQPLIDFLFWIHFIKPVYVIEPFEILRAVILIVVTSGIGYLIGVVFALVWNRLHR